MLTDSAKKAFREIAVVGCFVLSFSCAVDAAIPSAAECKAARAKLSELTSDDYKALKAKTNEQVGNATSKNASAKALMDRIEKDKKSVSDEKDQTEKRL